ncbi:MAG TPA: penicillin-binding protein 1C, partial [Nannocystaceae bacterium]|nr:penicillin-binding protein 1C [Nannocystaceae bacterium]
MALAEIGDRLVLATLTSEDRDFFEHDGVDRAAILRAVEQNLTHARFVSGASTVTQQLVKLLDTRGVPGPRTAEVKLREAARAQNLEAELGKPEILVEYMNRLPYGHGLVGPEAAAWAYFGVHARDLSWAQAAMLAVLPRAPSLLDPYERLDEVLLRQRALLQSMRDEEVITDGDLSRALAERIEVRPIEHPWRAPHLVQTLIAEDRVPAHGVVRTTLDLRLQEDVEGLVRTQIEQLADEQASNAAVIVLDNATGDVLAWVGSADHDDAAIAGQVDMVRARRQPGSTLKPFVYAAALAAGHTGSELVADVPTEFALADGRVYAPANFDGSYVGPISLREALATSLNVPMVRLAADLGAAQVLAILHRLGFASLERDADHYGLAIALGTGEVELRELAAAYLAVARGGNAIPLRYSLADAVPDGEQVLEPAIAAAVTEALTDPLARVRLLRGRSPFDIGFPVAVKTGTSSGYRDAWTVGYTAERTVAVWVGNANGDAMVGVTGAGGAGPLFADVMRRAMLDVTSRAPLVAADALELVEVCALSGLRPGSGCHDRVHRKFVPGHVPDEGCSVHVHARKDGHGPDGRARWVCDPEAKDVVVRLPPEFSSWLARLPDGAPGRDPHDRPWLSASAISGCAGFEDAAPTLVITSPSDGSIVHGADATQD